MNAIELLKSQHREVEALFAAFEKTGDKATKEKKTIVAELAKKIEIHAKLEEKIFYPEGEQADEELTQEAYVEHDCVRTLLKKIAKAKPSDESYKAMVTVLKEMIEHHVEEEEKEYFPECSKELGSEELERLGAELEAETEKLEKRLSAPKARRK